jgi:hypothetical protein
MIKKNYSSITGVLLYIKEPFESHLDDWKDAFVESPFFNLKILDISKNTYKVINCIKSLGVNDYIILHHSVLRTMNNIIIFDKIKSYVSESKANKISFIGDELNLPKSPLSIKLRVLKEIKPLLICTQLLKEAGDYLYGDIAKEVISLPHALNEKIFKPKIPLEKREIDLGYISVPYPPYLGDNQREKLVNFFVKNHSNFNLKVDIRHTLGSSSKRLNRKEWANFLSNTKGTFSSEAGSFYLYKSDELVINIYNYILSKEKRVILDTHNSNIFKKIFNLLPMKVKDKLKDFFFNRSFLKKFVQLDSYLVFYETDFEEIYEKFFKNLERPKYYGKAISSRHFEAMGTKTVQLLIEGRYNDIIKPYINYIPIKEDLSNIKEAIELFKDINYIKKVTDETYEFALDSHRYCHRLNKLYETILTLK